MQDNLVLQSTFSDADVQPALQELFSFQALLEGMRSFLPTELNDLILREKDQVKTIEEFQAKIIYPLMKAIEKVSISKLSSSGMEKLSKEKRYLFISNHRDIVLDSAFLNIVLFEHGIRTSQIAIGDNLMRHRISELIFKINKSFIVKRSGGAQELYNYSVQMSEYIQHLISSGKDSVWIAQREGRAKDGNDRTQPGLLKMFSLSAKRDLKAYFKSLHIIPVSISYELDPCDLLKTLEFVAKKNNPDYKKDFREDVKHILLGLNGQKGRVHFHFGEPLDDALEAFDTVPNAKKQLELLAGMIDQSIHTNYALHPINYIADDLLNETNKWTAHYTPDELDQFTAYFTERVSKIPESDREDGHRYLLAMYANPVVNRYAY